jgi:hypothetical protein
MGSLEKQLCTLFGVTNVLSKEDDETALLKALKEEIT